MDVVEILHTAFPVLHKDDCAEIVDAYALECYGDMAHKLNEIDVLRVKWMIGVSLAGSHQSAKSVVGGIVVNALCHGLT
jgi:hypothetical protein